MAIVDSYLLQGIVLGFLGLYALLLVMLLTALLRRPKVEESEGSPSATFAIVIPFKNEAATLQGLIERYRDSPFSVLFVNDHSTDFSNDELNRIFRAAGLSLLHLPGPLSGKKAALHYGIEHAAEAWILTSDADTVLSTAFLQKLPHLLNPEMAAYVLPVRPTRSSAAVRAFFDLEFIVLQAVGCAAAASGFPLLANGAAFLFRRDAYFESLKYRTDLDIMSGDDVFTLHAIDAASGGKSVGAILSEGPVAEADFPEGAKELWNQRLRWIGKSGAVMGGVYRAVVWLVFLANALYVWALIDGAVSGDFSFFMRAALLKIGGEIFLTAWGVSYFRRADCLRWLLPGVFIYPFYFFALLITALLYQPRWKQPVSEPVD